MAVTQYGKQVVREKVNAQTLTLDQDEANEGLVAQVVENTTPKNGLERVSLGTAATQRVAGVILNVDRAQITASSTPPLYPHGPGGGDACMIGKRGNFILQVDTAYTANVPILVELAAGGMVTTNASSTNPVGTLNGNTFSGGGKVLGLVTVSL